MSHEDRMSNGKITHHMRSYAVLSENAAENDASFLHAVQTNLAQIGKEFVWHRAGPNGNKGADLGGYVSS